MNASTLDTQEFFLYMLSFRVSPLVPPPSSSFHSGNGLAAVG